MITTFLVNDPHNQCCGASEKDPTQLNGRINSWNGVKNSWDQLGDDPQNGGADAPGTAAVLAGLDEDGGVK